MHLVAHSKHGKPLHWFARQPMCMDRLSYFGSVTTPRILSVLFSRGRRTDDMNIHFSVRNTYRYRYRYPGVGEIILGKKIHIESNESKKNMVPENSKTIYANSNTHNSIKTLRNDTTINNRWTVESPETRSEGTRPSRVWRSRTRRIMSGKGKFTKKPQAKGGSIASHTIKKSVNDYNYYLGSSKQASDYETTTEYLINHIKKVFDYGNDIGTAQVVIPYFIHT